MNRYYLKKGDYSWKEFKTKNFIAYYQAGSQAEKNLSSVERKIGKGICKAKEITKIDSIRIPVYFFIVNDKQDFVRLTGMNHTGISYARSNTIIESYFLLGQSHEIVHLISYQNWGNTRAWIMEGIAVYSDDNWNGKKLEKTCLDLYNRNQLIPLKDLIKYRFNHFDTQIAYPQSGCLVEYLIITFGWEKFLYFWKKPDIRKNYNLTEAELENNWMNYIKTIGL